MATAPGDNYASYMYRASVQVLKNGEKEKISLIIKAELENKEMAKFVAEGDAFGREINMFELIIPNLSKLLEDAAPGKYPPYGARCLYTYKGSPASFLVFEDLKAERFTLAQHSDGLDLDHCMLAIRTLAAYHAASVVFKKAEPEKCKKFDVSFWDANIRDSIEKIYNRVLKALAIEAENWPECKGHVVNVLKELSVSGFDHLVGSSKRQDDDFNVLCHGDAWVNNMMYRYEDDISRPVRISSGWEQRMVEATSKGKDTLFYKNKEVFHIQILVFSITTPAAWYAARVLRVSKQCFMSKPSECNAIMATPPDWITDELLHKILNSKGDDKILVKSSEITAATAPGDNYASNMYRASVQITRNGQQEKISLIIKSQLVNTEMSKLVNEIDVFDREITLFDVVIPTLRKLLEDSAPGQYPPYAAKCYYTYLGSPASFIVFEDLKVEGYSLAIHSDGLDMNHCLLTLRTLAAYHAASVVMVQNDPHKIDKFGIHIWRETMRESMEKVFNPVILNVALEAENWPECKGQIVESFKELSISAYDHLLASNNKNEEDFHVLCHGDVWMNNLMFRYSDHNKHATDMRFVDFQTCYWTSPSLDLVYFINANASIEVLENQNILIDEYHKVLCDTLNVLGHGHLSPKKSHIYDQYEKMHNYGLVTGIVVRSGIFAEKDSKPDIDKVLREKDSFTIIVMDTRPKWITDELLEKILNSKGKDKIIIQSSEVKGATKPGDNYGSNMYRASMQITRNGHHETISLVIKAELINTEMSKFMNEIDVFDKEITMFDVVIPTLRKMLEDAAPGKYPLYGAKCFYTHHGSPVSFLAFEDLKAQGYTLALHTDGLDMNHCLLTLRTLATYHAAGVVMQKTEPQKIDKFRDHIWRENLRESMEKMFNPVINNVALEAENWPECRGQIVDSLKRLSITSFDHLLESSKRNEGDFHVLCHGDVWLNNLMFRYSEDNKSATHMRFVDFQICNWGSPALDLAYFINSNASIEVLENQNVLIDEYHKVLCDTLNVLGHGHLSPKKSHIYEQYEKRHKFGIVTGIVVRSAIFAEKDSKPDFEGILRGEGGVEFSDKFKSHIRSVLSIFHKKEEDIFIKIAMDTRPDWITDELLAKILNSKGKDKIIIQSSEVNGATKPGDNYASNMYRASMQITRNGHHETISLVIKAELINTEMSKLINEIDVFDREITMFDVVIPTLRKMLEDAAPGKYPLYGAKCFYTHNGPPVSYLAFEDLKAEGYTLAIHTDGLDMNHCLLTLRTLAAYHAAGVVMEKTDPQKVDKFREHVWRESLRESMEKMFNPVMKNVALEAENWPECKGQIVESLKRLSTSSFDHLVESTKLSEGDFHVLCHGDVWVNNLMFRYSDDLKHVTNMRFVDFQICNWGSPALDLAYFINANASIEVSENQNILIDEYHKVLCDTLNVLGHGHLSPKKSHIYDQYEKRHKFGVVMGIVVRSTIFAEKDSKPDFEGILRGEGRIEFSDKFKSHIRSALKVLENQNILIDEYHKVLCDTLNVLGHMHLSPKKSHIYEQYEKRHKLGVEITMYHVVLPTLRKLLEDAAPGKYPLYAAKCFHTHYGPPISYLAFEDLKAEGYSLALHSDGLDMNHCLLTLRTLAAYHAAGVVMEKSDPHKRTCVERKYKRINGKMFNPVVKNVALEAENWPECKGQIVESLKELSVSSFDHLVESTKPNEGDFHVLCHGDVWLNNLMFRYSDDNKHPTHMRFVDFQGCYWASPALDLAYLINADASIEVLENQNILIEEYHKVLCDTLDLLGHGHLSPKKSHIYEQYEKRHKFGLITGLVVRSTIFAEKDSKPDMEGILRGEGRIQFSDKFKSHIRSVLNFQFLQRIEKNMEARPDFLTDELFEKAINSKEEETIKVVSSEITRATAPGDNFSSNIYRVSVQILRKGKTTPENLSLIVKVELQQTEMNKILPNLRKLLEDAAPGKYPPYSAKCYYTHKGPPASFLIFEDLKAQGYTLALQSSMLDWNHCLLGIRTLAAYHAASVVMEKAEPEKFNIFRKAFFTENTRKELEIFFNPTIKKLAAEAENWPECKGYIVKALNELGDCAYDKLIECHKRNDEDFN
ncbi:hypothetical protein C0J52_19077, partial [Blattella germanica]